MTLFQGVTSTPASAEMTIHLARESKANGIDSGFVVGHL
jgi:hypothetical protein